MIEIRSSLEKLQQGPGQGRGRPDPDRPAGRDLRLPRAQRGGQDDDHQADRRPAPARRRDDPRRRLRHPEAIRSRSQGVTTYVPDTPAIYERLTGLEYLNFIGDVYGVPKADRLERIEQWLDIFELASAVAAPIQSYSHGMKQKIVLIAALLPDAPGHGPRRAAWSAWTPAPPTT